MSNGGRAHIRPRVTISGSFRRDWDAVSRTRSTFESLGAEVLSPRGRRPGRTVDGFVYLPGDSDSPEGVEFAHLAAIRSSDALYVVNPKGYLGASVATEIGYALAVQVPIWSSSTFPDAPHRGFTRVGTPREVIRSLDGPGVGGGVPFRQSLDELQAYFRRVSVRRGFGDERPEDVMILFMEEVGELARAMRVRLNLSMSGDPASVKNLRLELADCLIYLMHMGNVLGVNLARAVKEKETLNAEKKWMKRGS